MRALPERLIGSMPAGAGDSGPRAGTAAIVERNWRLFMGSLRLVRQHVRGTVRAAKKGVRL